MVLNDTQLVINEVSRYVLNINNSINPIIYIEIFIWEMSTKFVCFSFIHALFLFQVFKVSISSSLKDCRKS